MGVRSTCIAQCPACVPPGRMPVSVRHRKGSDSACARFAADLSVSVLILKVFYHPTLEIAIGPFFIPTDSAFV
jgi:hypothetical protein